jgi:hypothetical protein
MVLFAKDKTADEVINMIAETLREADGKFIETIANMVLTEKVEYSDDVTDKFYVISKE